MGTEEFRGAVHDLLGVAVTDPIAVLCSESLWWRCHRRLLADHLVLVAGIEVGHVLPDGTTRAHDITSGARALDGRVVYVPDEAGGAEDAPSLPGI
jgi:uncharacterized protein (DUF488 family)